MSLEVLQILMYLVVGAAVTLYVILDGFDLGVGSLQIFGGSDKNRRLMLNSIGPFWDGNEVWLIVIVGGLFVGFPDVYASVLSGFYLLFMSLLCGIVFRAVAIEFRSKHPSPVWRNTWDFIFWLSSMWISFNAGVILANLVIGLPVNADREIYMSFLGLFSPYTILMGIFSIFLFAFHGNLFLLMKTEGDLYRRLQKFLLVTSVLFLGFLILITGWTWNSYGFMLERFSIYPLLVLIPLVVLGFIIVEFVMCYFERYGWAFLFSMLAIAGIFFLFGIGTFPNLVISTISPELSLDLYNSSSAYLTLTIALTIAAIGIPLVFAYGWILYHIFRGKTRLHKHSY